MSKKHNIAYVKPQEPSFLRKLKEQVGYKEGPTVDTKREDLGPVDENNLQDNDDELPQVVVIKPGDLTAEEVKQEQNRLEKEKEEAPADLGSPIVFKAPSKSKKSEDSEENSKKLKVNPGAKRPTTHKEEKSSKKIRNKSLLSFDEEEEDC